MTRQRAILVGLVGLCFAFTLLVGWARWELGEIPGDYGPFELAATRFWAGEALYQYGDDPFLSPPPFVFFLLPAHALGPVGGHAAALFLGIACSLAAIALLRRELVPPPSLDAAIAAALYLPIWLSASIGQWGGAFFLATVGVLALARAQRPFAAGLLAALLLAKPTYAPFVVGIVALGLGARAWAGLALGGVGWLLASLPLGLESWARWRAQLRWIDEVHALAGHGWQHHTLFGSLRALFELFGASEGSARLLWLAIAVPMGLAAIALGTRALRRGDTSRAFAIAALATIALNVYLRYYDSQIVLIAVLRLVARPDRSRVAGVLALAYLILASADAAYFQDQIAVPVEGLLVTAWLAIELREALAAERSTAAPPRSTPSAA